MRPLELQAIPTGRLHFTQISFKNATQEKIHNPSYSRRSPQSFFSNLRLTLIFSGWLYILDNLSNQVVDTYQ